MDINDAILNEWTNIDVVAIQVQQKIMFSKMDFSDLKASNNTDDYVIINLNMNQMITHTFPEIDRCCKLNGRRVQFDGIDQIDRIDCDIPKEEFLENYIRKREPIMMTG